MTPAEFRRLRLALGLSQEDVSEALGYARNRNVISRIEAGKRTPHPAVWGLLVAMHEGKLPVDWLARIEA